jgi:hypothetical protein
MPTTTGINAINVQTKSEPDPALDAATTIQMPKAINPNEIKYETRISMFDAYNRCSGRLSKERPLRRIGSLGPSRIFLKVPEYALGGRSCP